MYTFSPTSGERFYNLPDRNVWEQKREIVLTDKQAPSVTTCLGTWPKGEEYQRWLAAQGDLATALKARDRGGQRGSRVHKYIERLVRGEILTFQEYRDEHFRGDDFQAYDEWKRLEAFKAWHADHGYPTIVSLATGKPALECTLYSWEHWFAGTTDIVVTGGAFGSLIVMVDFKTGKDIYLSFWAQLAAYRHAWQEMGHGKIDAVGTILFGGLGRKHYRFEMCSDPSELDQWFVDFLSAQRIWIRENRKGRLKDGERSWDPVRAERVVYEVEDVLRLDEPLLERGAVDLDEEETPAWAQRPVPTVLKSRQKGNATLTTMMAYDETMKFTVDDPAVRHAMSLGLSAEAAIAEVTRQWNATIEKQERKLRPKISIPS